MSFSAYWRRSDTTNEALVRSHCQVQVSSGFEELNLFLNLCWVESQITIDFWSSIANHIIFSSKFKIELLLDPRSLKKGAQLALMNSLEKAIWNWMDNYRKPILNFHIVKSNKIHYTNWKFRSISISMFFFQHKSSRNCSPFRTTIWRNAARTSSRR